MMKKILGTLVCASLMSFNASAGLIEVSTVWSGPSTAGGKLSWSYEEGSNTISSMTFFDQSNNALLSMIGDVDFSWKAFREFPNRTRWYGDPQLGPQGAEFKNLQTGEIWSTGFTDFFGTTAIGVAPTLDYADGGFFGEFTRADGSYLNFNASNNVTRTPVTATVPEPAPMALFAVSLALLGLRRFRARSAA